MRRIPKPFKIGITFSLLIVAVALYATWSIWRRESLRHELINAVVAQRTSDVAAALEKGADPNARHFSNQPGTQGFWAFLKSLIHPRVDNRQSAPVLFYAVRSHNREITRLLLKRGSRIEDMDKVSYPSPARRIFALAVEMDAPEIIETLIDRGASVNDNDLFFDSYLSHAIQGRHYAAFRTLLARGAQPGLHDPALGFAIETRAPLEVVKALLDHGASPDDPTRAGETPVMRAVRSETPEALKLLIERGANLNLRSAGGLTAYQIAVKFHRDKALRILGDAGIKQ